MRKLCAISMPVIFLNTLNVSNKICGGVYVVFHVKPHMLRYNGSSVFMKLKRKYLLLMAMLFPIFDKN